MRQHRHVCVYADNGHVHVAQSSNAYTLYHIVLIHRTDGHVEKHRYWHWFMTQETKNKRNVWDWAYAQSWTEISSGGKDENKKKKNSIPVYVLHF